MSDDLTKLIEQFNVAQKQALDILESKFACPRPVSTMDYVLRCVPEIKKANYEVSGYKIRPHGYGMEIDFDGKTIDFYFGENGEFNGFDAWRLEYFVKENNIETALNTKEKIEKALKKAIKNGYIYQTNGINLYLK